MVHDGRICRADDQTQGETYTEILARHKLSNLTANGESAPSQPQTPAMAPAGAFAAKFVEVHVDPDLGLIRVARIVSAIDGGRHPTPTPDGSPMPPSVTTLWPSTPMCPIWR